VSLLQFLDSRKVVEKDMSDLNELSRALFRMRSDTDPDNEFPINPIGEKEWSVLQSPERYRRVFKFQNPKDVIYFMNELYKYQFEINHHCSIKVENLNVTVEAYTHDFNGITAQDKKIKQMSDDLYDDVDYFIEDKIEDE
tara:strand:- start:689 stop:1108 length:420 start_codon:yes stop_codon:yes gene_type:complete